MTMPRLGFHPVSPGLIPDNISSLPRPAKRLMTLLEKGSSTEMSAAEKSWSLDFCLNPTEFIKDPSRPSHVGGIALERTTLSSVSDPQAKATGTGEVVRVDSPLVFRSIGYKSVPLAGMEDAGIPFDRSRGVILNDGLGRVLQNLESKTPLPGLYCAGWVKRGPTGVIASTMEDAFSTADTIANDLHNGTALLNQESGQTPSGWKGVEAETPSDMLSHIVSWQSWQHINQVEKTRGARAGKERVKITSAEDMLALL
jgi:adrenodoxin-NADP+ reductase